MIKTYDDMVGWIRENIKLPANESAEDAALWFAAYHEAQQIYEMGVKDLGRSILDGLNLGPVDKDFVNDYIRDNYYDGDPDTMDAEDREHGSEQLIGDMENFWTGVVKSHTH